MDKSSLKEKLTIEQVKHIAKLVDIDISGNEKLFVDMLSDTLDYIKVLEELDTSDVDEIYQVTGMTNVFQEEGKQKATLSRDKALSNAKEVIKNLFVTKGVFD